MDIWQIKVNVMIVISWNLDDTEEEDNPSSENKNGSADEIAVVEL